MTIFILYCMHENNKLPALFKLHLFETDLYNVSQLKKNLKKSLNIRWLIYSHYSLYKNMYMAFTFTRLNRPN